MVAPVIPLESHLGPYRVLRQIGEGGMGVVYLGEDPQTGQHVALKLLAGQNKEEKSKALVDEALMARRIDHPNCVAVYGVVDGPGETPVIVSEFVDGVDARRFLDGEVFHSTPDHPFCFSPLSALLIIEQMFRGLREAHKIGITHQDIKPQNYLVAQWMVDEIEALRLEGGLTDARLDALFLAHREKAWIKLCDWGLALFQNKKIVGQGSVSMNYSKVAGEKRGGTLVYMPLEQLEGVGVSRRADIFPLGLILYELLTGRLALQARCHSEGLTKSAAGDYVQFVMKVAASQCKSVVISRSDPLLSELRKHRRLMRLLEKMTARDKKRRMSSRDLELTIGDYIERLQRHSRALVGVSPAWSIIPGFISVLALSILIYSYVPRTPIPAEVKTPEPKVSYKNELIPTLEKIDVDTAQAFVKSGLPALNFNSLIELDNESAEVLSTFDGKRLSFGKLKNLSPEVAEKLAQSKVAELSFDSLKVLELPVASSLAQYKGILSLGGLETMTYNASLAMSAFSCTELRVNGYQALHPNYLREFLSYEGRSLSFNGVKQLDSQSAKEIAGFKGDALSLRGLTHLSLADAKVLAEFRGVIDMAGLEYVDNSTLRWLQQHLQTFKVSDTIRKRFRRISKTKQFLFKTSITPQIAKTLVLEQYPQLILENLLSLDQATSEELGRYQGDGLHFHRLRSLEPGPAAEIVKCSALTLCLNSLKTVSSETARNLASFQGNELRLGIQELDVASARELAKFSGTILRFSKLAWVSPDVLEALVSFQGTKLYLGIRELSPNLARIAAEAKVVDTLALNALTFLQAGAAKELTGFSGARLEFLQLRSMTPQVQSILRGFRGDVLIFGARKLR